MPRSRNRASAKAAGSRWERAIADFLKDNGWPYADRRVKTGARDKGDIGGMPVVIEAKDCTRLALAQWVAEATEEAENAGVTVGVAWFKRRGCPSPADGYVVMSGAQFVNLLALISEGIE